VVVVQAREVAPAGIAAKLDETRAEHDAEDQPAQEPHDGRRRRPAREGARIEKRAEEDREEPRLQKLDLPAVGVPVLSDMNEGEIDRPEGREQYRVREA